jgi:hypothetical protein
VKTDEEDYGRSLLTPLRDEREVPLGPSTVDVAAAVARGRRRVRVRRAIGAGCAAAVVAAAVASVPVGAAMVRDGGLPAPAGPSVTPASPTPAPTGPVPPTACTVSRLTPDSGGAAATGVDPAGGQVLGRMRVAGARHVGLIWKNGHLAKVEFPGTDQTLVAANSSGTAIGTGYVDGERRGWVLLDGKAERLRAKTAIIPTAIGEDGTIVGYRFVEPDESRSQPVIWRGPRAVAEDLPVPGKGWYGRAVAIGADGTVLGSVTDVPYERSRGYLWRPDGTVRELPLPDYDGRPAGGFTPVALGDRWITGYVYSVLTMDAKELADAKNAEAKGMPRTEPPGRSRPMLAMYDRATGRFRLFRDLRMIVESGNAAGWVVGQTHDGRPMLLSDAGGLRLPTAKGLRDHMATGLSDDGRLIVGHAWRDGRVYALVWNCR